MSPQIQTINEQKFLKLPISSNQEIMQLQSAIQHSIRELALKDIFKASSIEISQMQATLLTLSDLLQATITAIDFEKLDENN